MNVNRLRCARAIFVKTTQMKRISIRKIQYTNFSNKALCYGVLTLNNLSIESCIELTFSHLNRLIASINTQLGGVSIYELIQELNGVYLFEFKKHFDLCLFTMSFISYMKQLNKNSILIFIQCTCVIGF